MKWQGREGVGAYFSPKSLSGSLATVALTAMVATRAMREKGIARRVRRRGDFILRIWCVDWIEREGIEIRLESAVQL